MYTALVFPFMLTANYVGVLDMHREYKPRILNSDVEWPTYLMPVDLPGFGISLSKQKARMFGFSYLPFLSFQAAYMARLHWQLDLTLHFLNSDYILTFDSNRVLGMERNGHVVMRDKKKGE